MNPITLMVMPISLKVQMRTMVVPLPDFDIQMRTQTLSLVGSVTSTSRIWKAMESNRFPHVFRKKKGLHF